MLPYLYGLSEINLTKFEFDLHSGRKKISRYCALQSKIEQYQRSAFSCISAGQGQQRLLKADVLKKTFNDYLKVSAVFMAGRI